MSQTFIVIHLIAFFCYLMTMLNFWKDWSTEVISRESPCFASSFWKLFQSGIVPTTLFYCASSNTHSNFASTKRIGRTRQVCKYCAEKIQWAIISNYLLIQSSGLLHFSGSLCDSSELIRPAEDEIANRSGVKMNSFSFWRRITIIL